LVGYRAEERCQSQVSLDGECGADPVGLVVSAYRATGCGDLTEDRLARGCFVCLADVQDTDGISAAVRERSEPCRPAFLYWTNVVQPPSDSTGPIAARRRAPWGMRLCSAGERTLILKSREARR